MPRALQEQRYKIRSCGFRGGRELSPWKFHYQRGSFCLSHQRAVEAVQWVFGGSERLLVMFSEMRKVLPTGCFPEEPVSPVVAFKSKGCVCKKRKEGLPWNSLFSPFPLLSSVEREREKENEQRAKRARAFETETERLLRQNSYLQRKEKVWIEFFCVFYFFPERRMPKRNLEKEKKGKKRKEEKRWQKEFHLYI